MRNYKKYLIFITIFLLSVSCDEELLIESKFREAYVLNCVLDANSNYQIATITRTYETRDNYPLENYVDRFVSDAEVYIIKGQKKFQLMDSILTLTTESSPSVKIPFYYIKNLNNIIGNELQIIAVLPSGDTLKSYTSVPTMLLIDYSDTDKIIPPSENAKSFKVSWNTNEVGELYFDPRLKILYYTEENGVLTEHFKDVPIKYENVGGIKLARYRLPSYSTSIVFSVELFRNTLQEIANEATDKSKCYVANAILEIYTFDKYLTSYYVGTHLMERFSIRLDEVDYYNIDGGFGIFGSFIKDNHTIAIDPRYLKSLGIEPFY